MHNAPAVSFPVGRSRFEGALLLASFLLAFCVAALWIGDQTRINWRPAVALLIALLAGLGAGWRWFRARSGVLHWDGRQWQFESIATVVPGRAIMRLDLQDWILLEFQTDTGKIHWFWLHRDRQARYWNVLRRALCARAGMPPNDALAVNFTKVDR
jgi:hypothetical protein